MYEFCNFQNERKGTYFEHSSLLQTNTSPWLLQMAQYIWNITQSHYYFKENSDIRNINTRTKSNLQQPLANLSTYQKGAYYYGIKVFNSLPSQIKDLSANRNQFRCALERFLYSHSFYTLDEYFSYNKY